MLVERAALWRRFRAYHTGHTANDLAVQGASPLLLLLLPDEGAVLQRRFGACLYHVSDLLSVEGASQPKEVGSCTPSKPQEGLRSLLWVIGAYSACSHTGLGLAGFRSAWTAPGGVYQFGELRCQSGELHCCRRLWAGLGHIW